MRITKRQLKQIIKEAAGPQDMYAVTVSLTFPKALITGEWASAYSDADLAEDVEYEIEEGMKEWMKEIRKMGRTDGREEGKKERRKEGRKKENRKERGRKE